MALEFDPNKPPTTKKFVWATYFPERRPQFKMYSQRGHALSSWQYREEGILYFWDETTSAWKEIFKKDKEDACWRPQVCEWCNKKEFKNTNDWLRDFRRDFRDPPDPTKSYRHHKWINVETSPKRIDVCYDCYYNKNGVVK